MTTIQICATTHTGLVRVRNEDGYGATGLRASRADGALVGATVAHLPILAVVADGLGGHPSGDAASALAVEYLLAAEPKDAAGLVSSVHEANRAIVDAMSLDPTSRGMGATVVAVLLHGDGLAVVNVGDSPALELVGERLVQLTTDDVVAQAGLHGIRSSAVTQSLGGGLALRKIDPHLYQDQVAEPRRLLLCTDGLTNFVPREHIAGAMLRHHPREVVEVLLNLALDAGGPDNVTCVLIDMS